jgi:hypothetical protein
MFSTLFLVCMLAASTTMAAAAPPPVLARIDVEKYVLIGPSVDSAGGSDADTAPGPYGLAGGEVYFKYWVKNTGSISFYSVRLVENSNLDLARCIILDPLLPGASAECVVGPFLIAAGQQTAPVTAIGSFQGGTAQDSDNAFYFGAVVALDIENYISVDAQATWIRAGDPPGPYAAAGGTAYFQYRGTNRGNVPLTGISLHDSLPGIDQVRCIVLEPLMPGASFLCTAGPVRIAAGQQKNVAVARGQFLDWATEDSDSASYFGVLVQLDIEDYVAIGRPETDPGVDELKWFDADDPPGLMVVVGSKLYRKWSGTNTGNVPLESVQLLVDLTSGAPSHCLIAEPVMPGGTFECVTGPYRAAAGVNGITTAVLGRFGSWSAVDSDATFYNGVYVSTGTDGQATH